MLGTTALTHPSKEMTYPSSTSFPISTLAVLVSVRSVHLFAQLQTLNHGWKGKTDRLAFLIYPSSAHHFLPPEPQPVSSNQCDPTAFPSALTQRALLQQLTQVSARKNTMSFSHLCSRAVGLLISLLPAKLHH